MFASVCQDFSDEFGPRPHFPKGWYVTNVFFFCWKRCLIISSIFWSNILFTKVLNDIGYDFNLGPISNFFNLILHVLTTMKIAQSKKKKKKYDCLLTTPKSQSIQFYYKIIIFFFISCCYEREEYHVTIISNIHIMQQTRHTKMKWLREKNVFTATIVKKTYAYTDLLHIM